MLWAIMGLGIGYLGHYFDLNKKKGLEIYLVVGLFLGYAAAFVVHFLIWPVLPGEINFMAIILGAAVTYINLRVIDYFFHL